MSPRERLGFSVFLLLLGAGLLALLLVMLRLLELPSELSTAILVGVLLLIVAFAGLVIWLVLQTQGEEYRRLAIAGMGLLSVGCALAIGLLPEHNATATLGGAVGVLPPAPGTQGRGFDVGLAAHLRGCNESVPVKFIINGSRGYWEDHQWPADAWQHFEIVLPGHFNDLKMGLGRIGTNPLDDPEQANIVYERGVLEGLRESRHAFSGKRDLTVVSGEVQGWSQTRRPVIVTAEADWITRRGLNDCNLQLPSLAGVPSALAVLDAQTCQGLDKEYMPGICSDPPGSQGTSNETINSDLEVSEAAAMVTGSPISSSESVPQPAEVDESPRWKCRAQAPAAVPQIAVAEAGSGSATAISQNDCHALATVVASSWHRDFLLVLVGALVAVGVHMMFQALVDAPRRRRRGASDSTAAPDPPAPA